MLMLKLRPLTFNRTLLLLNFQNSSYVIVCCLCPTRNFSPAIMLRKHYTEMMFNSLEWAKLIEGHHEYVLPKRRAECVLTNFFGDFTIIEKMLQSDVKELMLMQQLTSFYLIVIDISKL